MAAALGGGIVGKKWDIAEVVYTSRSSVWTMVSGTAVVLGTDLLVKVGMTTVVTGVVTVAGYGVVV